MVHSPLLEKIGLLSNTSFPLTPAFSPSGEGEKNPSPGGEGQGEGVKNKPRNEICRKKVSVQ